MHNLEQKRAAHALKWASTIKKGAGEGKASGVVKKVPSQVINNGLLAAMAFAQSKEGESGLEDVFIAFIDYYDSIASSTLSDAIKELSSGSAEELRLATAELMAYLNYLRRFV